MSSVEMFLGDSMAYDGVFLAPVCRELEPKFSRVFDESERNKAGVYLFRDTHVVAETAVKRVVGLASWIEGESYEEDGSVIVKNPYLSVYACDALGIGVRNGIYLARSSGIVFAGKVFEDKFTIIRPVVAREQDRFRSELEDVANSIEVDIYVSSNNR